MLKKFLTRLYRVCNKILYRIKYIAINLIAWNKLLTYIKTTQHKKGSPESHVKNESKQLALNRLFGRCISIDLANGGAKFTTRDESGKPRFYQSYRAMDIAGARPTDFRIAEYGLEEFLSPDKDVLDVGCNCGFFSLTISSMVNSITGLEYDSYYLKYGRKVAEFMTITNVNFISGDFKEYHTDKKFDLIFSFAVHHWIGLPLREYLTRLHKLLKQNGVVLFESHTLNGYDKDIEDYFSDAIQGLFTPIKEGIIEDGFKNSYSPRKFWYLLKS